MGITQQVLLSLFTQCAADVAPETLNAVIDVESSRNPYAIAVVYDKNVKQEDRLFFKQPQTEQDALAIIEELEKANKHKSYSVGIMQVNSTNFSKYGIDKSNMFEACKNIKAGAGIFKACYAQARKNSPNSNEQTLLRNAASCYYSGNEKRGYKVEERGTSYVQRINNSVAKQYKVPAIKPLNEGQFDSQEAVSPTIATQIVEPPKKTHSWDMFGDFKYY